MQASKTPKSVLLFSKIVYSLIVLTKEKKYRPLFSSGAYMCYVLSIITRHES